MTPTRVDDGFVAASVRIVMDCGYDFAAEKLQDSVGLQIPEILGFCLASILVAGDSLHGTPEATLQGQHLPFRDLAGRP